VGNAWHKTSFLEKSGDDILLKQNHQYYTQISGQMAITGIHQTFFVTWTTVGAPLIDNLF